MKDLLRTSDLSATDLEHLLRTAAELKRDPWSLGRLLEGRTVVLSFAKPSTRTRVSFETAVARLGGTPLAIGPSELQTSRGEAPQDTARVLSAYASAIVVRTFADAELAAFAAEATVPVINALTDGHHPCQSLADLLTLRERYGHRPVRITYVGDGNNVCHSLAEACALAGHHLTVSTPPAFAPDGEVLAAAQATAERHGGTLSVVEDPAAAVTGAEAVYTDAWLSMGDDEAERAIRQAAFAPYRLDAQLLAHAAPHAVVLHCLPAHRGEEITGDVLDGSRSAVWDQAANRLPTAQALLAALLGGHLTGGRALVGYES